MLATCKPRVGHKRRAPAASYLDEELEESCPSGSCQGLQPAQGAAAVVEEEAFAPAPLRTLRPLPLRGPHQQSARLKHLPASAVPQTLPRHLPLHFPTLLEEQAGRASGPPHPWHHHPAARPRLASSVLLRHRTRLLLPRHSCQLWHQGWVSARCSDRAVPLGWPLSLLQPLAGNAHAGSSPCHGHANATPRLKPNSPTLSHLLLRHQRCGCR